MNVYDQVLEQLSKLPQCVPAHYAPFPALLGEANARSKNVYFNTLTGMMVTAGKKGEGKIFGEKSYTSCSLLLSCQPGQVSGQSATSTTVVIQTEEDARKLLAAWKAQAVMLGLPVEQDSNQKALASPVAESVI
jgi:hypothetical protein